MVLKEKNLTYQEVLGSLQNEQYGATNPNLQIPFLVDGSTSLFDSAAIVDYLLRTYPTPASDLIQPPLASSITRPDHHVADTQILTIISSISDALVFVRQMKSKDEITQEQSNYLSRMVKRSELGLDWLEKKAQESGPEGFAPDMFSIMDLNLICMLEWIDFRGLLNWHGRSGLEAIVEFHSKRPSLIETQPYE